MRRALAMKYVTNLIEAHTFLRNMESHATQPALQQQLRRSRVAARRRYHEAMENVVSRIVRDMERTPDA